MISFEQLISDRTFSLPATDFAVYFFITMISLMIVILQIFSNLKITLFFASKFNGLKRLVYRFGYFIVRTRELKVLIQHS